MVDSFTLTLLENSSVLKTQYSLPIELWPDKNYILGLVEYLTFNSIPNAEMSQNEFLVEKEDTFYKRFEPQTL